MKKALALILAALFAVSTFAACNSKDNTTIPNNNDETVINSTDIDNSDKLTFAEVQNQILTLAEKQDIDNTIVMTIDDSYKMSLAEYRYYYLYWVNQFTYYYGADWQDNEEYVAEFNQYVDQDSKMAGIIVNLCEERNVLITQKEYDETIEATHEEIKAQYGDESDTILYNDFFATPNFLLENQAAYVLYSKLYDSYYAEGGEKFEDIKKQTVDFYNENDYVRAKHVLVQFPANDDGSEVTEEQKAEALAEAEEILNKANAGEDFDALITEYNDDPGMTNSPNGYYFGKGEMVEEFETAAYGLEEGAISGIVETTYGYHIIKRLPIDDSDIVTSDKFAELAGTDFNNMMFELLENTAPVKVENFDELVKPIHDEGAQYIADVKLQQEAANAESETDAE